MRRFVAIIVAVGLLDACGGATTDTALPSESSVTPPTTTTWPTTVAPTTTAALTTTVDTTTVDTTTVDTTTTDQAVIPDRRHGDRTHQIWPQVWSQHGPGVQSWEYKVNCNENSGSGIECFLFDLTSVVVTTPAGERIELEKDFNINDFSGEVTRRWVRYGPKGGSLPEPGDYTFSYWRGNDLVYEQSVPYDSGVISYPTGVRWKRSGQDIVVDWIPPPEAASGMHYKVLVWPVVNPPDVPISQVFDWNATSGVLQDAPLLEDTSYRLNVMIGFSDGFAFSEDVFFDWPAPKPPGFPRVCQASNGIQNRPNLSESERIAHHDLWFTADLGLVWEISEDQPYRGLSTTLTDINGDPTLTVAAEKKAALLRINPHIKTILSVLYREAAFVGNEEGLEPWEHGHFPPDSAYWIRDSNGAPVPGWGEDADKDGVLEVDEILSSITDFRRPDVIEQISQKALALAQSGIVDGIFLDWWNEYELTASSYIDHSTYYMTAEEEIEARLAILRRIRELVGDDFLILVNTNQRTAPRSAPYVNGMFMEVWKPDYSTGYTVDQLKTVEDSLYWASENLQEPRINCLNGWRVVYDYGNEAAQVTERDSAENRQWMRVFTTLTLTHSDGHVIFGDDNHEPTWDHYHNWYDFWDVDLGQPVGDKRQLLDGVEGLFIREFTNGYAVYNRSGVSQTIALPHDVTAVSTGLVADTHQLNDLDGDIYLRPTSGTPAVQVLEPATTAAPTSTVPMPEGLVTSTSSQDEGSGSRDCAAQNASENSEATWGSTNEAIPSTPPDTYLLTVEVQSTSQWTRVEVSGVNADTSEYSLLQGDSEIDFSANGLEIFLEESPEEDGPALEQPLVLTAEAVVQPLGESIVFRIVKPPAGTVTYTLSANSGTTPTEIARFVRDSGDEDNSRLFVLELDALPPPLSFAGIANRYTGPLFDTHLHLVGSKDHDNTAATDDRLHVRPETAEPFFATMVEENIVGLIGFLPMIHEHFIPDPWFNAPYEEGTLEVLRGCPNIIIPFLHPNSHIGIPPRVDGPKLSGFITDQIQKSAIPFRGIGEIHTGYPQTDSYAEMSLVDPVMLELFEYAAMNNLTLMIHPEMDSIGDLRVALAQYPNTVVLTHGLVDDFDRTPIAAALEDLFLDHDNIYFSVDANLMLGYDLLNDMTRTKEQFLGNLQTESTYYRVLASALAFWKPIIENHPTRMMWGTDLYYVWHYEPEVIHEIVRFGRDFIGGLDPEVQEMFGYRNALEMLDLPVE